MMAALPPCIAQQGTPMRHAILPGTIALTALLASAGCMHEPQHSAGSEQAAQPTTVDIQGADEWKRSPHMHAYYDETVAPLQKGTELDVHAYEARSFWIFREVARVQA